MMKRGVRSFLLAIYWPFRPLLLLFCWWMPFNIGSIRKAVLLPDSMAIFLIAIGGAWLLPYFGLKHFPLYCLAILLSPLALLNLIVVRGKEVFVFRLFVFIPCWRHRIPVDAKFNMYEAWEDPMPTGVAFEAKSYKGEPLHLGTSRSAEALYSHIGGLLNAQVGGKEYLAMSSQLVPSMRSNYSLQSPSTLRVAAPEFWR